MVFERPVTRYAEAPDGVSLAYQVTGDGSLDVVFPPTNDSPLDFLWDEPNFVRFVRRLGRSCRTVWCEARGIGASGGNSRDRFVDEILDTDFTTVLDAVGSERCVLVGPGNSGPVVIRYAVSHPDRVKGLVLVNTYAHYLRTDDYPCGLTSGALDAFCAAVVQTWGTGAVLDRVAPSKVGDEDFRSLWIRSQRLGVGRDKVAESLRASFGRDVRPLLGALTIATLVLHRQEDEVIQVAAGRYLAEHIPNATYVELPGNDHTFYLGDADAVVDEVEEFLTGTRQPPEGDVVTATLLFTDIVDSTAQSAHLGHRAWTKVTDMHDAMTRATLRRYRGNEVKTLGDGFLATFDATTRAVRAAIDIVAAADALGLKVRAGVHIGEVEVRRDDIVGLAVSIAKRICDLADPGHVFVSRAVSEVATGSGIGFQDRGEHTLKGVPGTWQLFSATA